MEKVKLDVRFLITVLPKIWWSLQVVNPLTSEPVVKCYAPGQTFDSVFGSLSSTFEECRADCVGLYLSANAMVH